VGSIDLGVDTELFIETYNVVADVGGVDMRKQLSRFLVVFYGVAGDADSASFNTDRALVPIVVHAV
jgi:hypothetical protein